MNTLNSLFIKSEKQLPEIPSGEEMETNDVLLGEMNMLLLKKINELTLHAIESNKTNQRLTANARNKEKR